MEDCKARVAIYISMKCKAFCSRSIYLSNCTRAVGGWNGWNEKIIFPALDINVESTEKNTVAPAQQPCRAVSKETANPGLGGESLRRKRSENC